MRRSSSTTITRPDTRPADSGAREEWIDCLRGITMLLVVMMHFEAECGRWMDFSKWVSMIRMPLFVFISGYFTYSPKIVWSPGSLVIGHYFRRLKLIIWPSLVILVLYLPFYMDVYDFTLKDVIYKNTMAGYWYTFAIFEMFLLCVPVVCMLNSRPSNKAIGTALLLILGAVAVYTHYYLTHSHMLVNKYILLFLVSKVTRYLPFFIAGILVHSYREKVWRICGNMWMPVILALIIFVFLNLHYHTPFTFIENTSKPMPLMVVMTVCVFVSFSGLQGVLNCSTRLGRILSLVGRNTLPIYLIHFFFNLWIGRVIIYGHFREFTMESVFWMPFVMLMTVVITGSCLGIYLLLERIGVRKYIFPGHPEGLRGYKPQQKAIKILQA